ncbi:helix-turn-helix domain-containing protein [Thermomonospora umbrina]|uniref:Helix-turn-helix protein n=1 Tax=Thermomonospora umbrina TaxID=111806 RepID=A0A3D9STK2_9ACTN|nr:helix-turn-helix transcriptional regulator [Thermomonospora umbrina]REE96305.1 helix-turn-helix protein [Thermomonospora umbrina]
MTERRKQPPTIRLRRFAAELRRLRKEAGLTQDEVVARTKINAVTLYRLETARVRPQVRTMDALLALYGADEETAEKLATLLRESVQRGWVQPNQVELPGEYSTYISFEAEAQTIWNFESSALPGLLQAEGYARAVIAGGAPEATASHIDRLVAARLRRQEVLRKKEPLKFWAIIDEAALRRRVGTPEVFNEQMDHLIEVSQLPNVTLQVIPLDAGAHPGMHGSFVVMQFAEDLGPNIVYVENMTRDLFLEEESDISSYTLGFEHLRAVALSPAASRKLVSECKGDV